MAKKLCIVVVAVACLLFASTASSQVREKQQKEVWKTIKKAIDAWKAGNFKEYFKHYHEKFTAWYPDDPFPITKRQDSIWAKYLMATMKVKFIILHPQRIVVQGNTAVAQYYMATMQTKKKKNNDKYRTIQWTDVWIKEGGKWKILATHGTRVKLK